MPGWQALNDELADSNFMVIGVALDETADDVRPLVEGISFPVLLDRDHVLAELYAVSNVPTVVWIDENGSIARPNSAEVGTDMFFDYTGVRPDEHLNQVRAWVQSGTLPADAATEIADLNDDEIDARLAFRIAVHLRRIGEASAADWFASAVELAPMDFTVRRAAMPLQGMDPFGDQFFEFWDEWKRAGHPYHGIPRS
ncbi:MAG: TlpA disulfide reductase family protein [Acidimicrobiaceae bacterium]|nr:TlpA disulfide reductase family protein [Acidimicrobiaceae bacterium]